MSSWIKVRVLLPKRWRKWPLPRQPAVFATYILKYLPHIFLATKVSKVMKKYFYYVKPFGSANIWWFLMYKYNNFKWFSLIFLASWQAWVPKTICYKPSTVLEEILKNKQASKQTKEKQLLYNFIILKKTTIWAVKKWEYVCIFKLKET